ncbi:hypothetical protein AB4Z10_19390 [Bosea sp. RAF48]
MSDGMENPSGKSPQAKAMAESPAVAAGGRRALRCTPSEELTVEADGLFAVRDLPLLGMIWSIAKKAK